MNASPTSLLEALSRLDGAFNDVLDQLCEDSATRTLSDAELLAVTPIAESAGRRADTIRLIVAGEIAKRCDPDRGDQRLSARNGSANAVELLTRLTQIAASTANNRMRLSQAVTPRITFSGEMLPPRFPLVRSALTEGSMGIDSATAIVRVLDPIADRVDQQHLKVAEQELVAAATGSAPDDAQAASADETLLQAKVWELLLDPDGKLPTYERAMHKRGVTLGKERDGAVPVRGNLMPDVAAQFERLVDAHLNPRVEDRTEAGFYIPTESGPTFREVDTGEVDGPVVPHDPRTSAQKRHDVLATVLAVAGRDAETPTLGGAAPTLMVMISSDDLVRDDGVAFVKAPIALCRHSLRATSRAAVESSASSMATTDASSNSAGRNGCSRRISGGRSRPATVDASSRAVTSAQAGAKFTMSRSMLVAVRRTRIMASCCGCRMKGRRPSHSRREVCRQRARGSGAALTVRRGSPCGA